MLKTVLIKSMSLGKQSYNLRRVRWCMAAGKGPWCSPEDCAVVCGGARWWVALKQGQLVI
jgi:hypothetical protein